MRKLLMALCAAGMASLGCGKSPDKPKKTDTESSTKPAVPPKADPAVADKAGKTAPTSDPKGTDPKTASTKDPAPAAGSEKTLTAREMGAIMRIWRPLQEAMEKAKKPVEKAADLPVSSWVADGKAPPGVESIIAGTGGDVKTFGKQWARFVTVYGRTVGLPASEDSTAGRQQAEEDKAGDSSLPKAERDAARKEADRLLRERWTDANRGDASGTAPSAEEIEFCFKNRRLLLTMFNGADN